MTIERGSDWGRRATFDPTLPVVGSDAEFAALFEIDGTGTVTGPELAAVTMGDLSRTLGSSRQDLSIIQGPTAVTALPIDLGVITDARGDRQLFVASVVVRRPLWGAGSTVACNVPFVGDWNLAPRAHPNDGALDIVVSELSFGDRMKARSRLPTGSHVPHPDLRIRRAAAASIDVPARARVFVDGVSRPLSGPLQVTVVPDATAVAV